jgi:uncharacterized protein YjbI with pentapeptide repeats
MTPKYDDENPGCVFDHSILYKCDLSKASLGDTSLQNAYFHKIILLLIKFNDARVTLAKFNDAILIQADFSGALLQGVRFQGADLTCAIFENVLLKNCDFLGADLTGVSFTLSRKTPSGKFDIRLVEVNLA